jgi:Putative undecaprenyl diphosphate synthase
VGLAGAGCRAALSPAPGGGAWEGCLAEVRSRTHLMSVHSGLYFCDAYWPAFREIDFLQALRSFAARQNRRGA